MCVFGVILVRTQCKCGKICYSYIIQYVVSEGRLFWITEIENHLNRNKKRPRQILIRKFIPENLYQVDIIAEIQKREKMFSMWKYFVN